MMRRPLTTNPRYDNTNAALALASGIPFFRNAVDFFPPYCQIAETPFSQHCFDNGVAGIAPFLGFEGQLPPEKGMAKWPENALAGQHPTTFLQWGWAARGRQILFEIGDVAQMATFHFIRPGKAKDAWQLDDIRIDTGGEEYYQLPTDAPAYEATCIAFTKGIATAVAALNRQDWRTAQAAFDENIKATKHLLDDISDVQADEHEADWNAFLANIDKPRPWHP